MRKLLLLCFALIILPEAAFAQAPECKTLIQQFTHGSDASDERIYEDAAWPDATILNADGEMQLVRDVYFRGAGRIARTFEREVRVLRSDEAVQVVANKEIVQHYQRGIYSGTYHVAKNIYRCEKRGEDWRIASVKRESWTIGTNPTAARRFEGCLRALDC